MSVRGARLNIGYIKGKRNDNNKCVICKNNVVDKSNRRKVCSKCANDCLGGQWGNIEKTILKRIKKEENLKKLMEVQND